jgi:hypothetical protein
MNPRLCHPATTVKRLERNLELDMLDMPMPFLLLVRLPLPLPMILMDQ